MLLYIVRHGIAERPNGFMQDRDRSLTEEGKTIVSQLGKALFKKGVHPDAIITSPYLRAKQTADLLAAGLNPPSIVEVDDRLKPNSTPALLQEILMEHSGAESIMIVSHEPAVSDFATALCANNADRVYGFSPSSVCCVVIESIPTIRGSLYWFESAEEIIRSMS
ncbi:MAG: phosphohistidine phosphatase SixA [Ignavibacteriae bacterium]|nr:phosphohistidine phosphatase SixA [Ignavibacteriota bacterium]